MRLPRGVSGDRLIHVLTGLGYTVIRQKGSHVIAAPRGTARPHNNGSAPQCFKDRYSAWNPFRGCAGPIDSHRVTHRIALSLRLFSEHRADFTPPFESVTPAEADT